MNGSSPRPLDAFSRLLGGLILSPFPPLLAIVLVVLGIAALAMTPREEEPQIVVPTADVMVAAPGLSAERVERQVATPLEKLLYQIDGVEHVYSASRAGQAVVTVRLFVGEDREDSLVKIYNKIQSNTDVIPSGVGSWVVKPVEVDDVPVVVAALWSADEHRSDDHALRRIAEEVERTLQAIPDTGPVRVTGGRERAIRVDLDPEALAARQTTPLDVVFALKASNREVDAGRIRSADETIVVSAGGFVSSAWELGDLVVNVVDGAPVYLSDVARIHDGPREPASYTWLSFGPAAGDGGDIAGPRPAVFISVAKRKGANAVEVAKAAKAELQRLERELLPPEIRFRIVRDYGETADAKVDDLLTSLGIAVLTVVIFIAIVLGWRPALVVGLAVPICYCATLALDLLTGYTINRVTLFALILSLGLLVDDPITGVDNIERYRRMTRKRGIEPILRAMAEIRSALVMSTIVIVLAFVPLFFITGMMGPYMAPMAFNVPITVAVSTLVAFLVTPWLAHRLVKPREEAEPSDLTRHPLYRAYSSALRVAIASPLRARVFLALTALAFAAAVALPALRMVPLKLLPYDNKNEFQVVIDMPEGTTLERTEAVAWRLGAWLTRVPEVRDVSAFVGTSSPMDFNGMVRRYYLRDAPHQADLRVTLAPKHERSQQSHALVLRLRRQLEDIASEHQARIKLVEVPPGPPVVATVVAELYGSAEMSYASLEAAARVLEGRLAREPAVGDVDTSVEDPQRKLVFVSDKEKAALSGVSTDDMSSTLQLALQGRVVTHLDDVTETQPLPVVLRLAQDRRSSVHDLGLLYVKGRPGVTRIRERGGVRDAPQPLVPLVEVGHFKEAMADRTIYHKDLKRVAYVFAESLGRPPADIVVDVAADRDAPTDATSSPPDERTWLAPGGGISWSLPPTIDVVWSGEGEWDITLRVFRDLGIAFAAALGGIFVVLLVQTGLATLTGIIMLAIPLSVIGIMPGFWLLNQVGARTVAGYADPVLFTATAMIGMIALAGIVVRNSLVLVEFVHDALRDGFGLEESLVRAGAIRMRPIFLTAGTTLLGNLVITLDPIFSGLAWSVIFGIVASTAFTLGVVPVVYWLAYRHQPGPTHVVAEEQRS